MPGAQEERPWFFSTKEKKRLAIYRQAITDGAFTDFPRAPGEPVRPTGQNAEVFLPQKSIDTQLTEILRANG